MAAKPIVLVLLRYYLPGFKAGGPTRSMANLISSLKDEFDFHVVCLNRDFRDQAPYKHVPLRRWVPHGGARVLYVTPYDMMPWKIASTLGEIHYDLVYINSFFDALFSISPLLAMRGGLLHRTPVIIAPRGEFAASELDLKGMKKRRFVLISRFLGLHERVVWH